MASLNTEARAAWRAAAYKDPDEIEQDIDDTRAEVQATLEALEHKLSPDRLLDMTLGRVREHGGEFAGNLGHAVKENPVPLLLTSLGVAWMMLSSRRNGNGYAVRGEGSEDGRWRDRLHRAQDRWSGAREGAREHMSSMKETLHGAGEGAREHLAHSRDTMSHAAESMRDTARRAGDSMRDTARRTSDATRARLDRARSGAEHLMHEQPLVLGAIGLAAGVLIGAVLPASASEDRLLGSARDRTLDRAKRAGEEGYRRAREHAEELADQAKSKLRGNGHGRNGSTSAQQASESDWPTESEPSSTMTSDTREASEHRYGDDSERRSDEVPNFGENPTEPRQTKRRASERGVGREHVSDSFTTPDQSPTSKTPPL